MEVCFVPVKEAKFKHRWLLTLRHLSNSDVFLCSTILQRFDVPLNALESLFSLLMHGFRANPNVNLLEVVKDVNIALQEGVDRQARQLLHFHAATPVAYFKQKRLEVYILEEEVLVLLIVLLSTHVLPKLVRLFAFVELELLVATVSIKHLLTHIALVCLRLTTVPNAPNLLQNHNKSMVRVKALG